MPDRLPTRSPSTGSGSIAAHADGKDGPGASQRPLNTGHRGAWSVPAVNGNAARASP
jgi:hypothetical protein